MVISGGLRRYECLINHLLRLISVAANPPQTAYTCLFVYRWHPSNKLPALFKLPLANRDGYPTTSLPWNGRYKYTNNFYQTDGWNLFSSIHECQNSRLYLMIGKLMNANLCLFLPSGWMDWMNVIWMNVIPHSFCLMSEYII